MNTLVKVPFQGDTLLATRDSNGVVYVAVKHICESLGIAHAPQHVKLQEAAWGNYHDNRDG